MLKKSNNFVILLPTFKKFKFVTEKTQYILKNTVTQAIVLMMRMMKMEMAQKVVGEKKTRKMTYL